MSAPPLTESERALITSVALRERWKDPARPPESAPGPRSLPEQAAISRYVDGLRASAVRHPNLARRTRIAYVTLGVLCTAALIGCLMVSVTQTMFGLVGGGLFALWSWRRARRRRTA